MKIHSPIFIGNADASGYVSASDEVYAKGYELSKILSENLTVNFNNSMTIAQMQELVDDVPKDLNWLTLTFQFADGTYDWGSGSTALSITGFSNGIIYIQGNPGESATSLHTNQAVHINGTSFTGTTMLRASENACRTFIQNIKFTVPDISGGIHVVGSQDSRINVRGNYFLGTSKINSGSALYFQSGFSIASANYFSNVYIGVSMNNCHSLLSGNDDTGTLPNYGYSNVASIASIDGVYPSGSIGDTLSSSGGIFLTDDATVSGTNTGDQVGDGVTITGAGTSGDPFVATGLSSYDSGWFAVSGNSNYSKTHNLGTTKLLKQIWFSTSADGSNSESAFTYCTDGNHIKGMVLSDLTTTSVVLQTGEGVHSSNIGSGIGTERASGYARIILVKIP